MSKLKPILLAAAFGLGTLAPAAAQDATADTVVATVNGQTITLGHMIALLPGLSERDQQLPDEVLFEGLLERLIQQSAISQSATDLSKSLQLRLETERNALIASDVVNRIAAQIDVAPEDVQAAYDARFAEFSPPIEYNASHILVATEDEAKALVTELEGGADFAELAREKSTGPTGPNGGSLGWFGQGRMVKPFEDAVVALEVGQVSGPVESPFGWHVIKLNETRIPSVPTLDSVREELTQQVWQAQLRAAMSERIDAAMIERPDISGIDRSVLRDLSLIDN